MKRVAIIGCPGAGKTTFSRKLAAITGLPIIHLDYYYHQTKYDYYKNKEAWVNRVNELTGQNEWIMDGNYNSTIENRFKRADTIFFFDFPRWTSMYGVIKRRIRYHNKVREEMPSDWKEKANLEFLRYVWGFRKTNRPETLQALKNCENKKIVTFKNRRQVKLYLQKML